MDMEPNTRPATGFAQPLEPELLVRARAGERAAQGLIYRRYEQAVYTLLRRMVDCADTAADLMQDSFLDAFARIHQFRGESPFGGQRGPAAPRSVPTATAAPGCQSSLRRLCDAKARRPRESASSRPNRRARR